MDAQKVDMFMMSNGSMFPEASAMQIRESLSKLDESKWGLVSALQFKSPITALIISLFLGSLGIDRFFIGETGKGILKLITCGCCGIWTLIDWFLIMGATRNSNYKKLSAVL